MKQSEVAGGCVQMLLKANGLVSLVNTQTCIIPSSAVIKKKGFKMKWLPSTWKSTKLPHYKRQQCVGYTLTIDRSQLPVKTGGATVSPAGLMDPIWAAEKCPSTRKCFILFSEFLEIRRRIKKNIYGHSRREGNYGRLNNVSEEITKYSNFDRHQK